jgi:hypothetical protein
MPLQLPEAGGFGEQKKFSEKDCPVSAKTGIYR